MIIQPHSNDTFKYTNLEDGMYIFTVTSNITVDTHIWYPSGDSRECYQSEICQITAEHFDQNNIDVQIINNHNKPAYIYYNVDEYDEPPMVSYYFIIILMVMLLLAVFCFNKCWKKICLACNRCGNYISYKIRRTLDQRLIDKNTAQRPTTYDKL